MTDEELEENGQEPTPPEEGNGDDGDINPPGGTPP